MGSMKFNLRQKIFLHFFIFMIVNGAIWGFIYYSNYIMNQKLRIIEKKNDLLNTILEARRYEKNFFLRNNPKDLFEALAYINKTEEKQRIIQDAFADHLNDGGALQKRSEDIRAYKDTMMSLSRLYAANQTGLKEENAPQLIKALKETVTRMGRDITTQIEQVERQERENVFTLLNQSKTYILISLLSLFILTILTAFFLILNVNKPLKSIEDSIRKIAQGDYTKIPLVKTGDEFESLADSLNNMIEELDKRKDQLVQVEKMSSLGTLTSGVAHELNNPLNNISTSIQIVREELSEPDLDFKKDLLIEAENQIDRARDIIRALLEFSRQSAFTIESVNFLKLVQSTMHLISGEIPANIDIRIEVPDNIEGKMDPRRIQQVILNLIINSIHAMAKGGRITISSWKDDEASKFAFQVKDTGTGMSKEQISKIFDPFFTTKDVGKGSGLGLSIAHGIIEQHGGTITVESEREVGTAFTVHLPD